MSKESRDELLERILEETARNPYKPKSQASRSSVQTGKKTVRPVQPELNKQTVKTNENIRQSADVSPVKSASNQATENVQTIKQEEFKPTERTQVFENPEISKQESVKVYEPVSATEKIQKIKQEKAAAAKAAIMRKAEIDNSRIMQNNGIFDAQQQSETIQQPDIPAPPVFEVGGDGEKVNIFTPADEYDYDVNAVQENTDVLTKIMRVLNYAVCLFMTVFVVLNYIVNIAGITGDSMKPTLSDGDKVLSLNVMYKPERNDVVIIDNKTAALFDENGNITEKKALDCKIAKRIIAVSGDTIDFDFEKGTVTVNGEVLDESYISEPTTRNEGAFEYPLTVPEGYVFVLGDNRNLSKDSRHEDVGLVPVDEVTGKVFFGLSPFGSIK